MVSFENSLEDGSWEKNANELLSIIPVELRPLWAQRILWAVAAAVPKIKENIFFEKLIDLLDSPKRWGQAFELFEEIRHYALRNQGAESERTWILFECVAKCVQNSAKNNSKKYDADSAARIVASALHIASELKDSKAKSMLIAKLNELPKETKPH